MCEMADIRTWSKDVIVDLLALYKSFPCLWKIKSEEYKNKNLKENAYSKLVDFCKEEGFSDANRDFVVKKIQSLRGSFRKELKKVSDSQRTGRRADNVYTSSLWYYNHLLFTKDQELPTSSFSIDDEPEDGNLNVHETDQTAISTNEQGVKEGRTGETGQRKKVIDVLPAMTPAPALRNKRKATSNYQENFFKTCTDSLKMTRKKFSEFDIVGMNIGKKLAKMDPVQAIYAESILNNVLCKGLLRQLTENTDLCDSNYCKGELTLQVPHIPYTRIGKVIITVIKE